MVTALIEKAMNSRKILVIEDSPTQSMHIKTLLENRYKKYRAMGEYLEAGQLVSGMKKEEDNAN